MENGNELKKMICSLICAAGEKFAEREVNSTCTLLSYQEIIPEEVIKKYEE